MNITDLGRNPAFVARDRERARRENGSEKAYREMLEHKELRKMQLMIMAGVAFFSNFIFWFDDPKLDSGAVLFMAVIAVVAVLYMLHHDIIRVLYIFTVYISFQKVLAGDFGGAVPMVNATNILLVLLAGAWISRSFLRGERIFTLHAIDVLIIMYVLLLVLSMLRSEFRHIVSPMAVVTNFKRLTEVFVVYFIFANIIKERNQVVLILFSLCTVVGAVGIMGVKQYYMDIGGGSFSNMDKNKITILADQPNQLASYFCNYSFYLLALFFTFWKRWSSLILLILFVACWQSTRVTFSRGGLVAFYCASLVVIVLSLRWKSLFILGAMAIVVMAVPEKVLGPRLYRTYANLVSEPTVEQRLKLPDQGGEKKIDDSAMSRLWIMEAGIRRIRKDVVSMFFGVGLGLFPSETMGYHPKVLYMDAHNQWLLILVECGSIALVTMWLIFIVCTWKAFHVYFKTRDPVYRCIAIGYIGGLVGLFIANFFGSRMNSNEIIHFHWIMTAVMMRVDYLVKVEVLERQREERAARRLALGL